MITPLWMIALLLTLALNEFESKIELTYENGTLNGINALDVKGRQPLPAKELAEAVKFCKKIL